jgi:hypothetical protein
MCYGVQVRVESPTATLWAKPGGRYWHTLHAAGRPMRWRTRASAAAWAGRYYKDWPGIFRVTLLRERHLTAADG